MSFTAYPEYKKLTFQALGCIPGHWSVVRFKQVYREINERSEIGAEELLSVSEYYGVKPRSEKIQDGEHLTRAESLEGYKKCKPGDLVMNIMLAWKRGLGISNYVGIVSPAYAVFRNIIRAEPRYFHYLLRTDEYIGYFKAYSAGVIDSRLRLYPEVFSRLVAITPPLGEQTQIARFLDHETAKIDALIAEQKRLIKLLQEKRQAVISHAVTKGLDPNVPMKDSGVEWLGEVPAHWGVAKLSHVLFLRSGDSITSNEIEDTGAYPVYGGNGLRGYTEKFNYSGRYNLIGRQGALCGNITIAENKFFASEHAVVCTPIRVIDDIFFYYLLTEMDLGQYSVSAAQPGISVDRINQLKLPLPDLVEQNRISEFLERKLSGQQILIDDTQTLIELLKERRSALISAAVTGKIDVRDWQPPADESAFDVDVQKAGMEASA